MSETYSEAINLKKGLIIVALERFRDVAESSDNILIDQDVILAQNAIRHLNDLCEMFKDL